MPKKDNARPSVRARLSLCLIIGFMLTLGSRLAAHKRPLDTEAIESWRRITERVVSSNGHWIAYKTEPWKGNLFTATKVKNDLSMIVPRKSGSQTILNS